MGHDQDIKTLQLNEGRVAPLVDRTSSGKGEYLGRTGKKLLAS